MGTEEREMELFPEVFFFRSELYLSESHSGSPVDKLRKWNEHILENFLVGIRHYRQAQPEHPFQ